MARNKFPKGSKVKLLMCDNPECKCANSYVIGEDAVVDGITRKHIYVTCVVKYENLMTRRIMFTKDKAGAHMELLEKPVREKPKPVVIEEECSPMTVQAEQYKLPLRTT